MTVPAIPKVPSRNKLKSRKSSARQVQAKPDKKSRTTIPFPQEERIRQRYISGQSIRKIAREEKRDHATVTKIVKGPEIQGYVQNLREEYYGLGELALDGLRRALMNSKDGRLAVELLTRIRVIPTVEEANANNRPAQSPTLTTEEAEVKAEMLKLVEAAYERAKIFSMPLPSLEDVESEPNVGSFRNSDDEL